MKGSVRFWVVVLVVAFVVSLLVACRDDVVVPFPPTIDGIYTGYYSVMLINLNNQDTAVDTSQLVQCRFREPNFSMVKDGSIPESLRVFCDVEGEYELGNGVALSVTDPNFTRGVCTEEWNPSPTGDTLSYGLDQTTDTMRMLCSYVADDTLRWIKLFRLVASDN